MTHAARWIPIGVLLASLAAPASAAPTFTTLALSGTPSPGGPPGTVLGAVDAVSGAFTPAIDAVGGAVLVGRLALGSGGVTSADDTVVWGPGALGAIGPLAREGDPVPGAAPGWTFADFLTASFFQYDGHALNGAGRAAFTAPIENVGAGESGDALFLTDACGVPALVAGTGDVAPDTPAGTTFLGFGRPALSASGRVAVYAHLTHATDPPVDASNDIGIWSSDADGLLRLRIRRGDPAPGVPGGPLVLHLGFQPRINPSGELLVSGILELRPGEVAPEDYRYVLWRVDAAGGITLIARTEGPAPGAGPGALFGELQSGSADFNAAGEIALNGRFAVGAGGVTSANDYALWVGAASGSLSLLLREGDPAPGAPAGAVFDDVFTGSARINGRGQVSFAGRMLPGAGGVVSNTAQGIWGPGADGSPTLLARSGDPAPDLPDRYLGNPYPGIQAITDRGEVIWQAALKTTPTGSAFGRHALLIASAFRPPSLLASNLTPIEVAPGDSRSVSGELFHIHTGSAGGGLARGVNETSQVVLRAAFTDASSGVFRIDLPPTCADGLDNDGDANVDYPADPGCRNPLASSWESPACDDEADNDGDGFADFGGDPGCNASWKESESPACDDGIDNEGDGKIDHPSDPQCASRADNDERPSCGLGAELVLLGVVMRLRRLDRVRAAGSSARRGGFALRSFTWPRACQGVPKERTQPSRLGSAGRAR